MTFQEIFSKRFKELRLNQSLTQEQLAAGLNEARTLVNLWETGKRFPGVGRLISIADFFNVSTDYLLGRTDDPMPPKASKK